MVPKKSFSETIYCAVLSCRVLFARLLLNADLVLKHFELLESRRAPLGHTVLEDYDGRHAAYLIFCRQFGIAVDIDLDDIGVIAYFLFQFFEYRGLHLARAAPSGEEVDKRGLVAVDHILKFAHNKIGVIDSFSAYITPVRHERFRHERFIAVVRMPPAVRLRGRGVR